MKSLTTFAALAALVVLAAAQSSSTASAAATPTEVTGCHTHGDTPYCFDDADEEWEVETDVDVDTLPDAYTDCHSHGADELHCASPEDVTLSAASTTEEETHDDESPSNSTSTSTTTSNSTTTSSAAAAPTEVIGCHTHGDTPFCFDDTDAEWEVETDVDIESLPDAYTDCHAHSTDEIHCESPEEVTLVAASTDEEDDHTNEASATASSSGATTTETQAAGNAASATEIPGAVIMLGAAVVALCVF